MSRHSRQKKNTSECIYDNCEVYSLSGELLSYTSNKKAGRMVKLGLADKIDDTSIKLRVNKKKIVPTEILVPRNNQCVVCGISNNLTRHHVIPYEYSKYLSEEFKKHNYGNILVLCSTCHNQYEIKALELKNELAIKYDAPIVNHKANNIYNITYAIINKYNIPFDKKFELYERLSGILGISLKELTDDKLELILAENNRTNIKSHSQLVMEKVEDKYVFIKLWKEHFINNAKPNYLPSFWFYYLNKKLN